MWQPTDRPLSPAEAERLLTIATANADKGRPDLALGDLDRILADFPDHHRARYIKATVCINLRRGTEAGEAVAAFPDDYLASDFEESFALARFFVSHGFLYQAEPFLKRLLRIRPDHAATRKELLRLCRMSGENAAAAEYLAVSLREPRPELGDLLMATGPLTNWADAADVKFMKQVGQKNFDPLTMLGYARRELQTGKLAQAADVLRQILAQHPGWQPALAQFAIVSWQLGRNDDWQRILADWNPDTLDHADSWFIWGVWHLQQNDVPTGIRCLGEALQRNPKHAGAVAQLIIPLRKLGMDSAAAEWTAYAERLTQLDHACLSVGNYSAQADAVTTIVRGCAQLGWRDEAGAWNRFGRDKWPELTWPESDAPADSESLVDAEPPLHQKLLTELNHRRFPLPRPARRPLTSGTPNELSAHHTTGWRLDDEAASLGIDFRFANGLDPQRSVAYMFEFSGPGIGVLDFDGDGWPDLHLTQGARWPVNDQDHSIRDELFRNLEGRRFVPVADAAGLGEPGYSQGPAVGDFNGDGFPDVYICNIGPNRCYVNNGDGTFAEVTAETGVAGDDWSLSAAWADFNRDGLSDLYVVNYLAGNVLERACVGKSGRPIQCEPTFFPGAYDRLYLNLGDGTFQDVSEGAGVRLPDGKGMGIVVGRLQDSGQVGIFIANDMTANFLLAPKAGINEIPIFENVGAIVGVAFGPQGTAQSSMGVAAGDVNGDGRLDLFVTNFLAETSNLFLQGPGGIYEDAANRFGLTAGGLLTEGWGTQFLDVDADGHLDLFVANGHLEEFDAERDRMPPQLFRNHLGTRLELASDRSLGRYFAGKYLGRAAAVWDWNRDGREDLAVSHVSDPVAVLTNRTENIGHWLRLRLVGTQSAREPIGAQVTLASAGRTLIRELVGGNGYTASNERCLYFGLGTADSQVDLSVDWSGGDVQHYSRLQADREYVLIEGYPNAMPLTKGHN